MSQHDDGIDMKQLLYVSESRTTYRRSKDELYFINRQEQAPGRQRGLHFLVSEKERYFTHRYLESSSSWANFPSVCQDSNLIVNKVDSPSKNRWSV